MSDVKLKNFVAGLILLVCFITAVHGAESSLLCFGEDGHVSIEFVLICTNPSAVNESSTSSFQLDHCGPCTDILSLGDLVGRKAFSLEGLLLLVSIATILRFHFFFSIRTGGILVPSSHFYSESLNYLRAVVLII